MQKITCLILEDEPLAVEVLQDYVNDVPFLELVQTCNDSMHAAEVLGRENIDLIFLDLHLPKIMGLDFIKTLERAPKIVVTSAYQDYALEGYELNIVDYLLKPIDFNRFLSAVNKVSHLIKLNRLAITAKSEIERPFLFFNVGKKKVKLFIDEILYIESLKEYIKIVTQRKSILTKFSLGHTEELLNNKNFSRIHRSFIIAKDKVDTFSASDVEIQGKFIPIGRSYKDKIFAELER